MSRHFTTRKMYRMTPNQLLRPFFDRLGVKLLSIDWRRLPERCDNALTLAVNLLPGDRRDELEAALAAIHELACKSGVQTILEAAKANGHSGIIKLLPEAGPYHIAMWTWLHHPGLFDQAAMMQSVDNLTRWRRRKDLPRVEPRRSAEAIDELASAISVFLRREEGRGEKCSIEHYRRSDGTDFYVTSPDDFIKVYTGHDEAGNLEPRAVRPTFEIVFAYHQDDGTLDLFAQMPTPTKVRLESLFGQIILGEDIGPQRYEHPYDLNRLKDRYFCLDTDPEDGLKATITGMRIYTATWGKIDLEPVQNGRVRDVYEMIDRCLNRDAVPWDEVQILKAKFRFHFAAKPGRRACTLDFDVTHPDHCTVKSRQPELIELVRKYLRRWRISHV